MFSSDCSVFAIHLAFDLSNTEEKKRMKIDKAESGRKKETKNMGGNAWNRGGSTVIIFWDIKYSEKIRLEISEDGADIRTPLLTLTFKMFFSSAAFMNMGCNCGPVFINKCWAISPVFAIIFPGVFFFFFPLICEKSILSHSLVKILRW